MSHNVMVILEAKAGKETELKEALLKVAELSRKEESNVEYRVYQDKSHATQFALFEKWKSRELHQEQFSKPYIISFIKQTETLLAKPYQAVIGDEIEK